jgi:hypothetical protein
MPDSAGAHGAPMAMHRMSLCVVVGVGFLIRAATRKDLTTAEEVLARHFMLVAAHRPHRRH